MNPRLLLALSLLFVALPALAAPPARKAKVPPASEVAPQDIDVDALARAKDAKPGSAEAVETADKPAAGKPTAPDRKAKAPPASEVAPQEIDVDALARAKDVKSASAETTGTADKPVADKPVADKPVADKPVADKPAADKPAADASTLPDRPTPLAPPSAQEQSLAASCTARASALLDALQQGDFAAATRDFDASMRSSLPAEKLRAAWDSLARFGNLQARGQSHASQAQGYIAITIPLVFDQANLYAQTACGSDGRIAGFYIKPLPVSAQ